MKSLPLLLLAPLLASSTLFATCKTTDNLQVNWTAFKTPLKKGVSGTFSKVITNKFATGSINDILIGSKASIFTTSINSNNAPRDKKLWENFFALMSGEHIDSKVISLTGDNKKGLVTVNITMNKISKNIPMMYTVVDNKIVAKGVIDLFDFTMQKSLTAINTACFDLHQGKTWSDVNIAFTLPIS